jgi:hypothetical protein
MLLRKNYFAKIIKYMKKVYNIDRNLERLTDGRKNPTYKTNQVILPVLSGFLLRIRSFNELNNMLKTNEFKDLLPKGIKLPKIDAIRFLSDRLSHHLWYIKNKHKIIDTVLKV